MGAQVMDFMKKPMLPPNFRLFCLLQLRMDFDASGAIPDPKQGRGRAPFIWT